MRLQDRLKDLRQARGYSLRELRDRIENRTGERMSVSYLSELERLETTPSVEVLARVANGYDMTFQELVGPVHFTEDLAANYPQSLLDYQARDRVPDDEIAALAHLEFRGHRPQTIEEWKALHSTFDLIRKGREQ